MLTIGRGIGLGVVINHQLYRGHKGGVGEVGHITLLPDGPPCDCGKRGCLEALAAGGGDAGDLLADRPTLLVGHAGGEREACGGAAEEHQ